MKIWKYELEITDVQFITIPMIRLHFLSAQMQNGKLCVWVKGMPVKDDAKRVTFYIYGTGLTVDDDDIKEYIGTVQDGSMVWHVFWHA